MGVLLLVLLTAAGTLILALAGSELAHWAASRRCFGPDARRAGASGPTDTANPAEGPSPGSPERTAAPTAPGTADTAGPGRPAAEVIVVLGRPTRRDGRLHPAQRWRTEIAVRSMTAAQPQPDAPAHGDAAARGEDAARVPSLLVFTGAATQGAPVAEATTMARYAREVLGVPADQIIEETKARSTKENLAFTQPFLEDAAVIKIVSGSLHAARARQYLRETRPDLHRRVAPAADYRPFERPWQKLISTTYELTRPLLRHLIPALRSRRRRAKATAGPPRG
jgi:uncharacterized SAM-binding protein YcdF (DUF218 family)